MSKPLCILKMKDGSESYRIHKKQAFDLPFRLLIVGRSLLSGKTNAVANLVLRPYDETDEDGYDFYKNDFIGEDIYIVCPSTALDTKWRDIIFSKRIPADNIYSRYDEGELSSLYDKLEAQYHEEMEKGKPKHKLVIFDDCSFGGSLKEKINGVMARFACNSRHILISLIVTSQKLTDILTTLRENASGFMCYNCSQKQLELFYNDVGEHSKKEFIDAYRRVTKERHTFMVVNYSNDPDKRFLDSNFLPIPELS